jgi:hypothetical protein
MGSETMKPIHSAILGCILAFSAIGIANAGPWQFDAMVREIIVEGEDDASRVYLVMDNVPDQEGCTNRNHFRIYANTEKGKRLLELALISKREQRKVGIYFSGCDDWARPRVGGLWLQR